MKSKMDMLHNFIPCLKDSLLNKKNKKTKFVDCVTCLIRYSPRLCIAWGYTLDIIFGCTYLRSCELRWEYLR